MGFKSVCITCRNAFSEGNDIHKLQDKTCNSCGSDTFIVHHKFKPPKKSEIKKWTVVEYLLTNGFRYETYWEPMQDEQGKSFGAKAYGRFPETMRDAKEFLENFKNHQ